MVDKGPLTSTSIRVAPSTFKFNWCTRVEKAKLTNWHLFGFFLYSTDDYRPSQKKRHITQKSKLFSHSWLCIQCGRIPTCPGDVAPLWFRLCKYYTLVSFQYVTVCGWVTGFKNLGHSCHSKAPLGLAVGGGLCVLFAWVETTMMTPKPEYLVTLATYLRVRW